MLGSKTQTKKDKFIISASEKIGKLGYAKIFKEEAMNTALKRETTQFELTTDIITKLNTFKLTPTAKLVLLYLTTCYNPKHKEVFPKQKTIAEKLGVSEISVTRAISELHKEGLIISERKISNKYAFTSRIVSEPPNKMKNIKHQNDSEKNNNLILSHDNEQTIKQNKQQTVAGGNVYSGDDAILYEYAKTKATKSVDAYIRKLKESGSAKKIIGDYKKKHQSYPYTFRNTELLREKRQIEKQESTSFETSEVWINFGLKHGIKK